MSKLTLNIFEKRYLEMIDKAVDEDIPLAIAPSYQRRDEAELVEIEHESTPYVYKFCGHGKVQILGSTPQGAKIIMIEGAGKGEIQEVSYAGSFNEVQILEVEQEASLSESSTFIYRRLKSLTAEKLLEHLGNKEDVAALMRHLKDPQSLVAFYCDHILQGFQNRLEVFKVDDLEEKLLLLGRFRVHH